MKAFVIGNGPSLEQTPLELLEGQRTFAVNRIWKMFDRTSWRPTDFVRAELPEYDGKAACEDLRVMGRTTDARLWIQAGFFHYAGRKDVAFGRPVIPFLTCSGRDAHPWHFELGDYLCGYGTVVQMAMQIAILEGAESIYLLGCDLGQPAHFYGKEGANNDAKNMIAHKVALQCSPIPIYNCTVGGTLEVYPRAKLEDVL